jgi:hypothetical protein
MSDEANPLIRSGEDRWPERGVAWARMRRAYDAVARRLARSNTRGTIAMLDVVGRAASALRLHGPSPREVAALYDWLPPERVRQVGRHITAAYWKNRAAIAIAEGDGIDQLSTLIRWPADPAWREVFEGTGGRVIVACHVGAFFGIRAALERLGRPALTLRELPLSDQMSRARALKQAIDHLRQGGLVVATLDGPGGTSTSEVPCLGRRIVLRRGPFTLARLTGAPLVPVVCAWTRDSRIAVRVAAPIECHAIPDRTAVELEDAMAARAASWLEQYLRAEPQEIWLSTLRYYLAAPRVGPAGDSLATQNARRSSNVGHHLT